MSDDIFQSSFSAKTCFSAANYGGAPRRIVNRNGFENRRRLDDSALIPHPWVELRVDGPTSLKFDRNEFWESLSDQNILKGAANNGSAKKEAFLMEGRNGLTYRFMSAQEDVCSDPSYS